MFDEEADVLNSTDIRTLPPLGAPTASRGGGRRRPWCSQGCSTKRPRGGQQRPEVYFRGALPFLSTRSRTSARADYAHLLFARW